MSNASVAEQCTRQIFHDILRGRYPAGARLPAERELRDQLEVSRVSLREALSRLADWGVLSIKRGSGATVQPRINWRFNVIALTLQQALDARDLHTLLLLLEDALAMRRHLACSRLPEASQRLQPGDLDQARHDLQLAWEQRQNLPAFARADLHMIRSMLAAANMFASLWTLNALADAYLDLIDTLDLDIIPVRDDYMPIHMSLFDALELGQGDDAQSILQTYLEQLDQDVLAAITIALAD